ncbi:MAG: AraC family transcriptional regulator [Lachnospiraceae bacterium]|nr:AraC family transcriptional regulator [Lachnospiraceae bacterium]
MNPKLTSRYTDCASYKCLENLRENSLELSLVHCGKEQCTPQHYCTGKRDEYIIHFVVNGSGTYSTGGRSYKVTAGQMFLLYPDTENSYVSDTNDPWTYVWVGFKGILSDNLIYRCGFIKDHLVLDCPDMEPVLSYFEKMLEYRQLTFTNDIRRHSILMELFAFLIDERKTNSSNVENLSGDYSSNIYVSHAIQYIQNFYHQEITVPIVAEYVGISRAHLNNSFQKELGISVQKFIMDYRLHKAAHQLVSTTDSVTKIAADVGYSDSLVFSKAFKKKFHVSPKNYRTEHGTLDSNIF